MIAALAALEPSRIAPSEIRRVTEQVLAQPRFDEARPGLVQRFLTWVLDRIGRLLELLGQGDGGVTVSTVAFAVVVVLMALLTVLLLRRVRRDRGIATAVTGLERRSAGEWYALARRAEASGDWASALRCTYRGLLSELVVAGVTEEVAGRTAREYLRDIADAAPDAGRPLRSVTDAFEATWYDRRPVDAADLDAVRSAADDVRSATLVDR